tara:strand:- start:352 stop:525 length:174 start_codon:yes stop_codon:yes gene_type:complete
MEETAAMDVAQEVMEVIEDAVSDYLYDSEILHGTIRMRDYKREVATALIELIEDWGS